MQPEVPGPSGSGPNAKYAEAAVSMDPPASTWQEKLDERTLALHNQSSGRNPFWAALEATAAAYVKDISALHAEVAHLHSQLAASRGEPPSPEVPAELPKVLEARPFATARSSHLQPEVPSLRGLHVLATHNAHNASEKNGGCETSKASSAKPSSLASQESVQVAATGKDGAARGNVPGAAIARWDRLVTLILDACNMNVNKINPVWSKPGAWLRNIQWHHRYVDIWGQCRWEDRRRGARNVSRRFGSVASQSRPEWRPSLSTISVSSKRPGLLAQLEKYVVVEPLSTVRLLWVVAGMFLMLYDLIEVPLQAFEPSGEIIFTIMLWFSQVFWTVDVAFTFFTGVYINSELVKKVRRIAYVYATSWLPLDASVTIALWFVILLDVRSELGDTFRFFRLLRFLRLLRLAKFERTLNDILSTINSPVMLLLVEIAKLMLCLILVSHINACLWFYVGQQDVSGWTAQFMDMPPFHQYLCSLHWVITQFQGNSDINPGNTTLERAYAVCSVLFAVLILAIFVSSLTNLIMQLNQIRAEKTYQQRLVGSFLSYNRISIVLSIRAKKYIQQRQKAQKLIDQQQQALKILPTALQMDLMVEVRTPAFTRHEFFRRFITMYPHLSRSLLHDVCRQVTSSPDEIIFGTSETCVRMYFVDTGDFYYVVRDRTDGQHGRDSSCRHKLGRGHYLSEPCLWMHWQHKGDLVCDGFASLLVLAAHTFGEIISMHPQAHASCVLYAKRYIAGMARFRWSCTDMVKPGTLIRPDVSIELEDRLAHAFSAVTPVGDGTVSDPVSAFQSQNWISSREMSWVP